MCIVSRYLAYSFCLSGIFRTMDKKNVKKYVRFSRQDVKLYIVES